MNVCISGNVETVATPGFEVGGVLPSEHYQMYVHTYTHIYAYMQTHSHSCSMGVVNVVCVVLNGTNKQITFSESSRKGICQELQTEQKYAIR